MKTITVTLYTLDELKLRAESVYDKLYEKWKDQELQYPSPWCDEILQSLEAWCKLLDFRLTSYNICPYYYSYIHVESIYDGDESEIENVHGRRAIAHVMNNLHSRYTIPYSCKHKDYKKFMKYGKEYRAGKIKPYPLTGYYVDELLINKTIEAIKRGDTLKEALESLAYVIRDEMESDQEQQCSEESFLDANEDKYFTIDGVELCLST